MYILSEERSNIMIIHYNIMITIVLSHSLFENTGHIVGICHWTGGILWIRWSVMP